MDNPTSYNSNFVRSTGMLSPMPFEAVEEMLSNGSISRYHIGKNVISADNLVIGVQGHSSDATWTPTANNLAWDAHTLILGNNRAISINAGNASITNPSLTYYIYYRDGASTYNVSTIRSDAVAAGRVLVNTARVDGSGNVTFSTAFNDGTQISGDRIKTGKIQSNDGRTYFDLANSKIQMSDASDPRVLIDGSTPKFVISKVGVDANSATASQSLIYIDGSETSVFFIFTAWSPSVATTDAFTGSIGAVIYDSGNNKNAAPAVSFYKPSNWTITSAKLYTIFYASDIDNGSAYVQSFPQTVRFRLNATRTRTTTAYPGLAPYYRFLSGTVLTMDGESNDYVNPSSDGQSYIHTFSAGEISSFNSSAWNTIVCQADTSSTTAYGYAVMNLVIEGYATVS